ncbi:MAG: dTDP-glucose 4,6-dehydratase [Burkholderiales bacterium]
MILVTGGAGFIGSNFVLEWITETGTPVVNLDKLTYAGNLSNLSALKNDPRHIFVQGDVGQRELIDRLLRQYQPHGIVHFAAESHVDRSIHGPEDFVQTNIVGSFRLLESARGYWQQLGASEKSRFRFVHVSTDEVYGSLEPQDKPFTEQTSHSPNSPYAASKAASDHLVRAYHHTYDLPVVTTNCSNNYGPYQFPEKFIPLVIWRALKQEPLPVYGDGLNIRDWLYVKDHCSAIRLVLSQGRSGETYNIGGSNEKTNLDVVTAICATLDEHFPEARPHSRLVTFVKDRPGHDRRYAMNSGKIMRELNWKPCESFESGLKKTVQWYVDHQPWIESVASGAYRDWVEINYAGRDAS